MTSILKNRKKVLILVLASTVSLICAACGIKEPASQANAITAPINDEAAEVRAVVTTETAMTIGDSLIPLSAAPKSTASSGSATTPPASSQVPVIHTGALSGVVVTVLDETTPAATSGSYEWPITKYYFTTADGEELGYISGGTCLDLQVKYGVTPPGGGPYEAPGGVAWEAWFADEFNKYRGLSSSTVAAGLASAQDDYVTELLQLLRDKRENLGLPELEIDESLMELAKVRAEELSSQFGHDRPDGTRETSECIARFQSTPKEAFEAWMKSDSHRRAILNENGRFNYSYVGAGCYRDEHGSMFWVLTFSV